MTARAIWKASVHVGAHAVAVKLYSAVEQRGVHFRLLHAGSKSPVQQQLVDPTTDQVVPYPSVLRGVSVPEGFVLVTKEELAQLNLPPSREIQISHFIRTSRLGPEWHVRPYYLGPDGDDASYFVLAKALADTDKEGVAHWVMRGKEYVGILRSVEGYLMLVTVRHAGEIIKRTELPSPKGRAPTDKELRMAEQLVAAYEDEFDASQYRDEYRERVLALVEAKSQGKRPRAQKPVSKRESTQLSDALQKSLAALKSKPESTKPASSDGPRRTRARKERNVA